MQGHFIWGIFSKRRNTVLPLLGKDSAPKTRTPYQEPLSPDPSVRLPAQLRGTATPRAAEGASPVGSPGDERPHSHAHRDGTLVRHAGPGQEQRGRDGMGATGPGQGTEPGAPAPTAAEVWTAPAAAPDWPRGTHAVRGAHHSHELAGRCGGAAEGSGARSRRVSCPRALLTHLPPPPHYVCRQLPDGSGRGAERCPHSRSCRPFNQPQARWLLRLSGQLFQGWGPFRLRIFS